MSSTKKIADIRVGEQNCRVVGRLAIIWESKNMKSKFANPLISVDGILVDEDGNMVQISVPKKLEKEFRPLLAQEEKSVCLFTNLNAVDIKQRTYMYHHQPYMLQFQEASKIHRLQSRGDNIPQYAFSFCPLPMLPSKDVPAKPLIDLIGVLAYIGPHDLASPTKTHKLRKIQIKDLENNSQEIQLWGQHGESFDEKTILEKTKKGIVVAVFSGFSVDSFRGKTQVSTCSASKIFIDIDIPEVANYRASYKWETPHLQQQQPKVQPLTPIQAAGKLYKINQITNTLMSSFQGGHTYSCIATIKSIVPFNKWYYKACKSYKKGYNNNTDSPKCDCPASVPTPMYMLPVTLSDETGTMEAIAFSYVAEELVEQTAYVTSQNMKIDEYDQVLALDKAIGKTKIFSIGTNGSSTSAFPIKYVLKKIFDAATSPSASTGETGQSSSVPLEQMQNITKNTSTTIGLQHSEATNTLLSNEDPRTLTKDSASTISPTKRTSTFQDNQEKCGGSTPTTSTTAQKKQKISLPTDTSTKELQVGDINSSQEHET